MKKQDECVHIYTDGSCNNKTGNNGGFGILMKWGCYEVTHSFGSFEKTTSARMELLAVIQALILVLDKTKSVKIYCDNQYVCFSHSKEWVYKWEKNGELTSRINGELWQLFLREIRRFPKGAVELIWIKGHNGTYYNEYADKLAEEGSKSNEIILDRDFVEKLEKYQFDNKYNRL